MAAIAFAHPQNTPALQVTLLSSSITCLLHNFCRLLLQTLLYTLEPYTTNGKRVSTERVPVLSNVTHWYEIL